MAASVFSGARLPPPRAKIARLFDHFMTHPGLLPDGYVEDAPPGQLYVAVCDYIAGMTDRFAIEEQRKLFQLDAWA